MSYVEIDQHTHIEHVKQKLKMPDHRNQTNIAADSGLKLWI